MMRRALHPPVHDRRFWVIQAMVLFLAGCHILFDHYIIFGNMNLQMWFPVGSPVTLFVIPVTYAALQFGLTGSAATGALVALLWTIDLGTTPITAVHLSSDLMVILLIEVIAFLVGHRIEKERFVHERVVEATSERLAAETRYRQLFGVNRLPTIVLDSAGLVTNLNPAAQLVFGPDAISREISELLATPFTPSELDGRVLHLQDDHDYRLGLAALPAGAGGGGGGAGRAGGAGNEAYQLILEDITVERRQERRASRYAQLVVQAEEDQWRRLARELHDEPLQPFLHLARRLESISEAPRMPSKARASLLQTREQALDAASTLRNLARALRPPSLDQFGLAAALSSLAADVESDNHVRVDLDMARDAPRLPAEVELCAFRIVQEAVRNTIRHAGADRLVIGVKMNGSKVSLSVSDDGKGFVPEAVDDLHSQHLGLVGMRERARLLGGRVSVDSAPGRGTLIEATIPLS